MLKERVPPKWHGPLFLFGWALLVAAGIGAIFESMWPQAIIALGAFAI